MDSNQSSKQPLVSVVLNSFNTENFIGEQIDSILKQTYTNLELIFCDDCSTDRTPEIVREYMQKDPRVKWVKTDRNLGKAAIDRGVYLTFQKGFQLCRGEFIALSDADDFWLPDKIQVQVDYLLAHPEIDAVFTDSIIANKDLSLRLGSFQKRLGNTSSGGLFPIDAILKRNLSPGHVLFFRRNVLPKIPPMADGFSHDSWVVLTGVLNSPLGYISQPTVLYRQHEGNVGGAKVWNLGFFLKRLNDPDFVQLYIKDKSGQMAGHKMLLSRGPSDATRKALNEKIANQTALFAVIQAKSFPGFIFKLFGAAWIILKSSQKYHLKQLGYLALSWGAIRKTNFQSQGT
jgi:glycosyltransferase involved in cell wall biosynthesis